MMPIARLMPIAQRAAMPMVWMLIVWMLMAGGCSDKESQDKVLRRRSNLAAIARMYAEYNQAEGQSPKSVEELTERMQEDDENDALACNAAREGDVTIIYDAALNDINSVADRVLAFEAVVPRMGGYVVTVDGIVSLMTAAEFAKSQPLPLQSATQ